MKHLAENPGDERVECSKDSTGSLVEMFVNIIQQGRIATGQCPALRPVFLKSHGVAHGVFRIKKDIAADLQVGLFSGTEYPCWIRFSSDTLPANDDYKSTVGIGLKLFDTPTPKIFGNPNDNTFDFIMQNMDVFFVETAKEMCEFTKAGVVDGDYTPYLEAHPKTKAILDEMAKPVGSALAIPYWAILPFRFGSDRYAKYKLEPTIEVPPPSHPPTEPSYLANDLANRLLEREHVFRFCVQLRTDKTTMPLDEATVAWPVDSSPFIHVADVIFPKQDIHHGNQSVYGENLSWNIWRVTEDHRPVGSIADARRAVYEVAARLRRNTNGIPIGEPDEPKDVAD